MCTRAICVQFFSLMLRPAASARVVVGESTESVSSVHNTLAGCSSVHCGSECLESCVP